MKSNVDQRMQEYLTGRKKEGTYRTLKTLPGLVDFSSNDYLGFARSESLLNAVLYKASQYKQLGSSGSRLLTGNSRIVEDLERKIASYHNAETALLFNSGYAANCGLISTVARPGDVIYFDELVHASLRQGIRLSKAEAVSFSHNDVAEFSELVSSDSRKKFLVLESVYSMDGDMPDLLSFVKVCERTGVNTIIDEAHATGVIGEKGEGLVAHQGLEKSIFARVHTFGKAMGSTGAVVLGSTLLRNYLVNYCKEFIYTTSLSYIQLAAIDCAYAKLAEESDNIQIIRRLGMLFESKLEYLSKEVFSWSPSAIQSIQIPGAHLVREISEILRQLGYDVRPIVYPTVPGNKERLRVNLHTFNTEVEVSDLAAKIVELQSEISVK